MVLLEFGERIIKEEEVKLDIEENIIPGIITLTNKRFIFEKVIGAGWFSEGTKKMVLSTPFKDILNISSSTPSSLLSVFKKNGFTFELNGDERNVQCYVLTDEGREWVDCITKTIHKSQEEEGKQSIETEEEEFKKRLELNKARASKISLKQQNIIGHNRNKKRKRR